MIPEWLQAAITDQQRQRRYSLVDEEEKKFVQLDRAMLRDLERSNFFSRKSSLTINFAVKHGRGVHLLKASAIEKRQQKPPKEYPLMEQPMTETQTDPDQEDPKPDAEMENFAKGPQYPQLPPTPHNTKEKQGQ